MKIGGGLILGNGWKDNLDRLLTSMSKCCDEIFIVDNSTDSSSDIVKKYPKVYFQLIQKRGTRHGGLDYTTLYAMALMRYCDWMFMIDADEILDEDCTRERIEKEIKFAEKVGSDSLAFEVFEMWNDENHYICHRNVHRVFKCIPGLTYDMSPHSSTIPREIQRGHHTGLNIRHLGHMSQNIRDEKRKYFGEKPDYLDTQELSAIWFNEKEADKEVKEWNQK